MLHPPFLRSRHLAGCTYSVVRRCPASGESLQFTQTGCACAQAPWCHWGPTLLGKPLVLVLGQMAAYAGVRVGTRRRTLVLKALDLAPRPAGDVGARQGDGGRG